MSNQTSSYPATLLYCFKSGKKESEEIMIEDVQDLREDKKKWLMVMLVESVRASLEGLYL